MSASLLEVDAESSIELDRESGHDITARVVKPSRLLALRQDGRAIMADGATFSLMVGIGETYLPALVLALGLGEIAAGLIATVPMLIGAVAQLITPWALARLGSCKHWVVACARLQAASLLLIPVSVAIGPSAYWLVFVAASLYWAAGMATGPAWNTWMESIIPVRIRARFFASRVRISQAGTLTGFVVGGLVLQAAARADVALAAFAAIFAIASAARFVSAFLLSTQSESPESMARNPVSLSAAVTSWRTSDGAKLLQYLFAVQVAVYIAGPLFTPFMLKTLQFSYFEYMVLVALGFLGKVIALSAWGRVAQRLGARRLLWIGGMGIVPVAGLWVVSTSYPFLAALQLVSGVLWAAYELAMCLLFLDSIPRRERTSLLTLYNLGNSLAIVVGGMIGVSLLQWGGKSFAAYLSIFAISSVARAAALVFLTRVPCTREPRS